MTNDRTCYNCDHWKFNVVYACDIDGTIYHHCAATLPGCPRWHRIRTEQEKKESKVMEESMKHNDELFKRLAKL